MAYQEDLTLHTYTRTPYEPVLSVGWLESNHPYTKGAVPIAFLQKLIQLMSQEGAITHWTRGYTNVS